MEQKIFKLTNLKEQFRSKDLSKLAFRKVYGYKFGKEDKKNPGHGWGLIKDHTSARILRLIYTDGYMFVYYPSSAELNNINDLSTALVAVKQLWVDAIAQRDALSCGRLVDNLIPMYRSKK